MLCLRVILHISLWITIFELISWDRCLLFKLPPGSLESSHTMLISVCVCKAFPLYDTSLCAKVYLFVSDVSPPAWVTWDYTASSADDQPGSQGPHSQLCWGTAQESGTTQPALLRTSLGVRDHTTSSAEDQPGSQGAHSQLCWGPAQESGSTQPVLLRTSAGFRDHTDNSVEEQPRSKGPHSQLCWGTDWESWTTWPTLLRNNMGVRDHSPLVGSTHWRIKVIFR